MEGSKGAKTNSGAGTEEEEEDNHLYCFCQTPSFGQVSRLSSLSFFVNPKSLYVDDSLRRRRLSLRMVSFALSWS